jgi:hypothetical protein
MQQHRSDDTAYQDVVDVLEMKAKFPHTWPLCWSSDIAYQDMVVVLELKAYAHALNFWLSQ